LHRCPFGIEVATRMIRSIRGAPILLGVRGRPSVDISTLAAMLAHLSAFAATAGPRLSSIDLNPVFAMPDGEGAFCSGCSHDHLFAMTRCYGLQSTNRI
jgi:acetate---CoA ligase (ADP-forming)